jgi:hypothetical protein
MSGRRDSVPSIRLRVMNGMSPFVPQASLSSLISSRLFRKRRWVRDFAGYNNKTLFSVPDEV